MNKYLLLRDNKQSGPYTAQEMIAKGIKPYDLVWVEGRSAAWRYPSEVDELKAFSPAVEEQPFDRFYKKPDGVVPTEKKSKFEPVIAVESPAKTADASPRKVYINFPGAVKRVASQPSLIKHTESIQDIPETPEVPRTVSPTYIDPQSYAEHAEKIAAAYPARSSVSSSPDKKFLYLTLAACLLLAGVVLMMAINSRSQSNSITQLNDLVTRMEKRQAEQNNAAKVYLSTHPIHAPESTSDVSTPDIADENLSSRKPLKAKTEPSTLAGSNVSETPPAINTVAVKKEIIGASSPVSLISSKPLASSPDLFSQVSVKSNNYRTGMLGGISNLQLVLTNSSSSVLQKVEVQVKYFSPEKKLLKTQTVFFEKIAAGAQAIVDVPKSSRGVSISYAITDIKS